MEEWGSGDLCERLRWPNSLTCSSCICFFVFPLFSLSTCAVDVPVLDVCSAAVSFDIFSSLPPALDQITAFAGAPQWVSSLFLSLVSPPRPHLLFSILRLPPTGAQEEVCVKKNKLSEDSSGLVPYGGDSSDDEEERTRCSKAENS